MLVLTVVAVLIVTVSSWYPENCGQVTDDVISKMRKQRSKRMILGGTEIDARSIPFVVRIDDSNGNAICTGTLVSRRHVLTAGHCFTTRRDNITRSCKMLAERFTVCYLTSSNNERCSKENTYHIKHYYGKEPYLKSGCHPRNDTMVLELYNDINATSFFPVCLPLPENHFYNDHEYRNYRVINIGYSDNQDRTGNVNTRLRFSNAGKAELCDSNLFLCTKQTDNSAICGGDSGGPMLQIIKNRLVQVGVNIVSNGICNYTKILQSSALVPLDEQYQKANIVAKFAERLKNATMKIRTAT